MTAVETDFRNLLYMSTTPTMRQVHPTLAAQTDEEHRALLERVLRRGSRWHEPPALDWQDVAVVAEFIRPSPSLGYRDAVEVGIPCRRHNTVHVDRHPRGIGALPYFYHYALDDVIVVVVPDTPRRPAGTN